MAKLTINIGQSANDKNGDPLRTAFSKVNANFTELYTLTGGTSTALTELAQDYAAPLFNHASHTNITVTYDDANNKILLTGVAAQVQSNWTATTGLGVILNKPALFSGSYTDLTSKPTLFSGSYTDLTNKPTIPTSFSSLVNGVHTLSLGSTGITTFPGVINAGNINNLVVNDLGGGTSLTAGSQVQIGNSAGIAGAGVLIKNAVTNTLSGVTSLESGSKIQMDNGIVSLSSYTYNELGGGEGLESRLVVEVDNNYLNNVVRIGTRIINTGVEPPTNVFQGVTISQYGELTLPGILKIDDGVHEKFQTKADATGIVTHDCSLGHIFYHTSPDALFTVNFTNLNLSSGYATALTLIIVQGGTGFIPNSVGIGGVLQTLNWQGNVTPTPSTNRTDVVTFSIINNSGTYIVLGQLTGF